MPATSPLENRLAALRRWALGLALTALATCLMPAADVRATTLEIRTATSSDDAEEPVGAPR